MRIAESYWRKAIVTCGVAVALVFFYQATAFDSRSEDAMRAQAYSFPQAGARLKFTATAYCKGETTASGVGVRTGIVAADPQLLPVGSVIRIETPNPRYSGVWTVMDTGPSVQKRTIDMYLWSCHEALAFGRRPVWLTVLRLGWNPENSIPGMIDALFRKREAERKPFLPSRPPALLPLPAAATPSNASPSAVLPQP
jgi:3D (Asp-Asp-Asp) domain-containing protein